MTWRRLWRKARHDAELTDWPRNALRDSFCTYWMAIHRYMPRCADLMGNSVEMVRQHYRASIRPEVDQEWWALFPITRASNASAPDKGRPEVESPELQLNEPPAHPKSLTGSEKDPHLHSHPTASGKARPSS